MIEALRPKLAQVPGFRVFLQNPPLIRIGGQNTRSLYQFTLQNPDTRELYEVAPKFEERLRQIPGLQDVTSDLQIKSPQINVTFDRDRIAQLGLSVDAGPGRPVATPTARARSRPSSLPPTSTR